jgi:hypothetical protein
VKVTVTLVIDMPKARADAIAADYGLDIKTVLGERIENDLQQFPWVEEAGATVNYRHPRN